MATSDENEIHLLEPTDPRNITALRKSFAEIDKNGDGYISKSEMSDAINAIGRLVTDRELEEMMRIVDTDGHNLVDFNQFLELMDRNCLVQSADKEMTDLFSIFDVDNDGFITQAEISNLMKKLGEKIRKKDIRQMIKEADKNKDGKIDFKEFKEMVDSGKLSM